MRLYKYANDCRKPVIELTAKNWKYTVHLGVRVVTSAWTFCKNIGDNDVLDIQIAGTCYFCEKLTEIGRYRYQEFIK